MGPILVGTGETGSLLLAYEHGSEAPNAFLQFRLSPDGMTSLAAVKGNYVTDQAIGPDQPFSTVWMQAVLADGDIHQMSSVYRRFILNHFAHTQASRRPHIYYNTWNFQERNKWWHGNSYLSSMNSKRILDEVEIAHRLGIDVFVLDTGWYEKTGDWTVSKTRFPDELRAVKAKLDSYGMELGLWFGPTSAAASSEFVTQHPEWRMSRGGVIPPAREVWETEKSFQMCLVSGYAEALARKLIQVGQELGVTYFKWDAIGQYGCDDAGHSHGNAAHTAPERQESYGFQLVHAMCTVAETVTSAIPGAVVDFDVTESDRAMGLAFLGVGKYFQMNNGPYYFDYDVPINRQTTNWNLFFYQGQARSWIARSQLSSDRWIPSILSLVHYFPDDPWQWQEVSVASLCLGHNGLWGDLLSISQDGLSHMAEAIRRYKQVADDINQSDPVVTGFISGSPEIHEKINGENGQGVVCFFATAPGTYRYVTHRETNRRFLAGENVDVSFIPGSKALITAQFDKPGARMIFFGAT
jgi:alpha-galactosidase